MEQLVLNKQACFARSLEKMIDVNQICFMEADGTILYFNKVEAIHPKISKIVLGCGNALSGSRY